MDEAIPFGRDINILLAKMKVIPNDANEVFLWELVRNAARALYLVRRYTLYDPDPPELFVHIIPDKSNHTLSIIENGIGMMVDDLKNRLFTIPEVELTKYKNAIDKLWKNEINVDDFYSRSWDLRLGFFAAHMVADNIQITTMPYGVDKQCTLISSASEHSFMLSVSERSFGSDSDKYCTSLSRQGTMVSLLLKEDHFEYLDVCRLKDLINKYTFDLCPYPISIHSQPHPCLDNIPCPDIIHRFADVEGRKADMKLMKKKFEGLRKLFKKVIGDQVKKVVVSDRIYDYPCVLSCDRKILEINPRNSLMEKLRQDAERNPDEEAVTDMITCQFVTAIACTNLYKWKHATDHV